ncbi:MAG: 6-phosphofructokinase [Clostridia bacterium]|nr:6-phosphofructokinase [Clostridia bacterium]
MFAMHKGNIIVGQSGGPTAVINASLAGVFQGAKDAGINKIYGMCNGVEGLLREEYVDLSDSLSSPDAIELLKRTPSSFLGSCRYKFPNLPEGEAVYRQLFAILEKLDIQCFIYIGGNDSMDTIMKLSAYAESIGSSIRFMGVPKTIDNDLAETDHTPGYGSAAKFVATTMKELVCDSKVYNMDAVAVVELMGRNAGWLTAAAALAGDADCDGADLIYLPERAFDTEDFLSRVDSLRKEKHTLVVAVSEGLKNKNGQYICEEKLKDAKEDAFGHKILNGTAAYLVAQIREKLGIKARDIVLNTTQRCAAHLTSLQDVEEAFAAGKKAVGVALSGHTGEMVRFRRIQDEPYEIQLETYDIRKIANAVKAVPDSWINESGTGMTEEFIRYCRPLIQGEASPVMRNGLPCHLSLRR